MTRIALGKKHKNWTAAHTHTHTLSHTTCQRECHSANGTAGQEMVKAVHNFANNSDLMVRSATTWTSTILTWHLQAFIQTPAESFAEPSQWPGKRDLMDVLAP